MLLSLFIQVIAISGLLVGFFSYNEQHRTRSAAFMFVPLFNFKGFSSFVLILRSKFQSKYSVLVHITQHTNQVCQHPFGHLHREVLSSGGGHCCCSQGSLLLPHHFFLISTCQSQHPSQTFPVQITKK